MSSSNFFSNSFTTFNACFLTSLAADSTAGVPFSIAYLYSSSAFTLITSACDRAISFTFSLSKVASSPCSVSILYRSSSFTSSKSTSFALAINSSIFFFNTFLVFSPLSGASKIPIPAPKAKPPKNFPNPFFEGARFSLKYHVM